PMQSARQADVVPEPAYIATKREKPLEGAILLVEEEEAVLEFERDVLTGAGAKVTTVTSLDAMKTILAAESFGGLILSGKMPGAPSVAETHKWIVADWHPFSGDALSTFS